MTKEAVDYNKSILIKKGKIEKIGNFEDFELSENTEIINAENQFIMPGLTDMHVHLGDSSNIESQLKMNIAAGVTDIRVMNGGGLKPDFKSNLNLENTISPRIIFGYLGLRNTDLTAEEIDSLLPELKRQNYDFIKLFNLKDKETFDQLMTASKKLGIDVCGHYPSLRDGNKIGFEKLLTSGFKSIEHLGGYKTIKDSLELEKLISLTKENKVYNCPTMDYYGIISYSDFPDNYSKRLSYEQVSKALLAKSEKNIKDRIEKVGGLDSLLTIRRKRVAIYEAYQKVLKKLSDNNCLLLVGSDPGMNFQANGLNMYDEMQRWSKAGVDHYTILKSATITPAQYFKEENKRGTIAEGKEAKLIILSQNPLENIDNIKTVHTTIVENKVFKKKDLLEL